MKRPPNNSIRGQIEGRVWRGADEHVARQVWRQIRINVKEPIRDTVIHCVCDQIYMHITDRLETL